MERLTLEVPAMYGDHHVSEVRRILLEIAGVQQVYASSCFGLVEVSYDPLQTDSAAISSQLEAAGYLGDLGVLVETAQTAGPRQPSRHTTAYPNTGRVISFSQNVAQVGRARWPCPGMGAIEEDGHAQKGT